MDIVVKLPDKDYSVILAKIMLACHGCKIIELPKGHGDLITKEQAIELVEFYQINPQHFNFVNLIDEIKDEKPIIEADRSEEE